MRAARRLGVIGLLLSLSLGAARYPAWVHPLSAASLTAWAHATGQRAPVHRRDVRMFNICADGFHTISPCTATGTVQVGTQGSKIFQIQNNSSMDDPMVLTCTKPGVLSACSVTPANVTIRAGSWANITLKFTGGAAAGVGVVLLDASGNTDLEASDTVTVNPIAVTPKDTTVAVVPDTTYTESFTVKNLGNVSDTVNLSANCSGGLTACTLLTSTPMALAALGSGTATVNVTTEGSGTGGSVTLTATPTHGVGGDFGSINTDVPVPLLPSVSVAPHNGYNHVVSLCASNCFDVVASYATPAYVSMDVPRSLSLVYSSAQAHPMAIVQLDVKDSSARIAQQLSLSLKRPDNSLVNWTNGSTELFFTQSDATTKRLAGQFDAAGLATGTYSDTAVVKSHWTRGGDSNTVRERDVPVRVLVVNEQASPYGAGWSIAGLQRLVFASDSLSIALIDGTGSIALFNRPTKTSPWVSPAGDFTTLLTILNSGTVIGYHRTYPDGTLLNFSTTGSLLTSKNRFNDSTQYHYNGSNQLTAILDPIGDSLTLAYASGKLSTITDPGGRVTHVAINGTTGNLTSITDPTGTTTFAGTYDTLHRLTQVTDRGGNTWLYRYDFASTIASDSTPAVSTREMPSAHRLGTHFRSTLAAMLIDTASHTGTSTTPASQVLRDSVRAIVAPPGADSVRFAVDPFGNPTRIEDLGLQQVTTITLNAASQATQTTTTLSGKQVGWTIATWSGPRLTTQADKFAHTAVGYTYDTTYNLVTLVSGTTQPVHNYLNPSKTWIDSSRVGSISGDTVTRFTHDTHGRVTVAKDPRGDSTATIYGTTGFHNIASTTQMNRVTSYSYDGYGRPLHVTLPGGAVTKLSYDSLNRPRSDTATSGARVTYAYDSLSNIRSITDAKGQQYQYVYNVVGWLVAFINADTNHTLSARTDSFFYTNAGQTAATRNRRGLRTSVAYDAHGRVIADTLSDHRVTAWSYDPQGQWTAVANAESVDTIKIDTTHHTSTESEWVSNYAAQHFVVFGKADTTGLPIYYTVSANGTRIDSAAYAFDADRRLTGFTVNGATTGFSYNTDGVRTKLRLPSGDTITYTPTGAHEPYMIAYSRVALNTLLGTQSQFDTLNHLVQRNSFWGDSSWNYAYDSLGRLVHYARYVYSPVETCTPDPHAMDGQVCTSGTGTQRSSVWYSYDSVGNRTDGSASYDPGNRLTAFSGFTLTYDADGNLTHKQAAGFDQYLFWSSAGDLDTVITNGDTVSFGYDGFGRRVRKHTHAQTLEYVYSGQQLVAEIDSASGTRLKLYRYYPGVDAPHSLVESGHTYYYLAGASAGSIAAIIDSTGAVKNRYGYAPFGTLEDSLETISNSLRFTAREYDPETELYYYRARYYDPQLGRFIGEDPIGLNGGINQYAYVDNDPVDYTDPSGLCTPVGSHDPYHGCNGPGNGSGSAPFPMELDGHEAWSCTLGSECVNGLVNYLLYGSVALVSDAAWNETELNPETVAVGCRAIPSLYNKVDHCAIQLNSGSGHFEYAELEGSPGATIHIETQPDVNLLEYGNMFSTWSVIAAGAPNVESVWTQVQLSQTYFANNPTPYEWYPWANSNAWVTNIIGAAGLEWESEYLAAEVRHSLPAPGLGSAPRNWWY